ncbi:MAG: translation initiation factor IF-3 [candidate division Zixibacteria bacterium RBG_16_43_9]|nr:MAG: translation initiation factor IF-3 [candidate division Zixibacteria bacterium RBG_16_43_9]
MADKYIRINERIRVPQVRLIDTTGEQIGIVPTREALRMALEKGFDLVEISPTAKPPVCKIMDYGKYKYELNKKAKSAKKKQHIIQMKEMRLRPKIEEHDYQFKLKHIQEFLEEGNKVKVFVEFRGREMAHQELGHKIIQRLEEDLKDLGIIEQKAKMEGRNLSLTFMPKG